MAVSSTSVAVNTNAFEAVLQASPVVQLTLVILIGLSIVCWGIALLKWKQLKTVRGANEKFQDRFWKSTSFESLAAEIDGFKDSPMARLFAYAYLEMQKLQGPKSLDNDKYLQLSGIENVERVLRKGTEQELAKLESKLTLLASTGSTGPFVGLFGTVWGIMGSFHKIGATGSASLAVVAPGISEALIATAIGLAAAIPAVVLYNHFVSAVRKEEMELNSFTSDFLNLARRNFFREA